MKKPAVVFIFSFLCLFGVSQTTVIDSIYSGGIYRNYRLYIPAAYNGLSARPLILNLHGYTSNASQQQLYSNFMPIADTANFLMVYPNGTLLSGQPFWNAGISSILVNDINFLSNLIDSLRAQYNIDVNGIYSTGMSNGGFMSHTLACELSHRIAAIASVTGSIFNTQYGSLCHPSRPVPVMQIHGTSDPTVPYAGNSAQAMMPIDSVVNYWVIKNGCNPIPVFAAIPNSNTSDGCTAEHYVYSGGYSGSSVELYKIIGGTHTWPGFPLGGVGTNLDINASKEIWRFFRQYKLNQLTSVNEINQQSLHFLMYPNPAQTILHVEMDISSDALIEYQLYNVLGEMVLSEETARQQINMTDLPSGMYTLQVLQNHQALVKAKLVKE